PLGDPQLLAGRLMTPALQSPADRPENRVVVRTPEGVATVGLPSLEREWSQAVVGEDLELLSVTTEQVLLMDRGRDTLVALDPGTGDRLWEGLQVRPLLEALGEHPAQIAAQTREQREFVEQMVDVAPLILQARRRGQVPDEDASPAPLMVG